MEALRWQTVHEDAADTLATTFFSCSSAAVIAETFLAVLS